eukprot:scaffold8849_cov101-Isochrysis_galbana.AAC.8
MGDGEKWGVGSGESQNVRSDKKKLSIRSASGRMRRDTLLSPGRLALPPFSSPPFTISPGARPIISGPGWGYDGGGPRRGVGRCGLPLLK